MPPTRRAARMSRSDKFHYAGMCIIQNKVVKTHNLILNHTIYYKIWMGGVSIISGSYKGAQGAFPARQIYNTDIR